MANGEFRKWVQPKLTPIPPTNSLRSRCAPTAKNCHPRKTRCLPGGSAKASFLDRQRLWLLCRKGVRECKAERGCALAGGWLLHGRSAGEPGSWPAGGGGDPWMGRAVRVCGGFLGQGKGAPSSSLPNHVTVLDQNSIPRKGKQYGERPKDLVGYGHRSGLCFWISHDWLERRNGNGARAIATLPIDVGGETSGLSGDAAQG